MLCHPNRVLVVDDDCATQLIMKRMIEGFGYECDTASDGQEAVAAASKTNYMAIMMDLFMPVMNGCDAAVSINRLRTKEANPVIVGMISIDEPAARKVCLYSGMQEVICKPIQRAALAQCLHQIKSRLENEATTSSLSIFDRQRPAEEIALVRPSPSLPPVILSARSTSPRPAQQRLRRRSSEPLIGDNAACPRRRSSTPLPRPRHP
jgi:CheY-like chemotaxis protein